MEHKILEPSYEAVFIDHTDYPPTTPFLLRGLAAAIQDSHKSWRPKLSELATALQKMEDCKPLVAAGASYGAGKHIMDWYPGPATLLFGAALNAVGSMPNVELQAALDSAEETLRKANLLNAPDVKAVIEAARQRAQFDKVGAMLRAEFRDGLSRSGLYDQKHIAKLVPEIVNATHDTRHRAMLVRWVWGAISGQQGVYKADPSSLTQSDEHNSLFYQKPSGDTMRFGADLLGSVVKAAQVGCAFALLHRIEPLRS